MMRSIITLLLLVQVSGKHASRTDGEKVSASLGGVHKQVQMHQPEDWEMHNSALRENDAATSSLRKKKKAKKVSPLLTSFIDGAGDFGIWPVVSTEEMQTHSSELGIARPNIAMNQLNDDLRLLLSGLSMIKRAPMSLDAKALQDDITRLTKVHGTGYQHYGNDQEKGWTLFGLITCDGTFYDQKPCADGFKPTAAWRESTYLAPALEPIRGALQRVRISYLHPGQQVGWHRDVEVPFEIDQPVDLSTYEGQHKTSNFGVPVCRVHIIVTNPTGAHLRLGSDHIRLEPGAIACGDFSLPHTLWHDGDENRISVLADVAMDPGVLSKSDMGRALLQTHSSMLAERASDGRTRYDTWKRAIDYVGGRFGMNDWPTGSLV